MKIEIIKEINQSKLYDELLSANLMSVTQADGTSRLQGNTLFLNDDTDIALVQAIINAHNPEQLPIIDEQVELDIAIASATTLEELKSALLGKNKSAKVKAEKK